MQPYDPGRLPKQTPNYKESPAALHALIDGSLDAKKMDFDMIAARKMKMKDSFNTLFPTYSHGKYSTTKENSSKAHDDWQY